MACLRSLSKRWTPLTRHTTRHHPSLSPLLNDDHQKKDPEPPLTSRNALTNLNSPFSAPNRTISHIFSSTTLSTGASFVRYMSTTTNFGGGSDRIDVATVLTDGGVDAVSGGVVQDVSVPAVVNEVAVAAADSFFPVAALQHVIDAVHSFTGLNWWASIVLTTILMRGATIPLLINQLKATSKLSILRPRLEEIKRNMEEQGLSPLEGQQQMQKLMKEYGVSPFTPLKGLFIQSPIFICFFLAISNMAEKVPSLKTGGAFWFVDLTTPDSLYIFPILTALTFWITVECNAQEGMEGNSAAATVKNISRFFAAASVPLTMSFPKAIFCYWVTSNVFSLAYGLVLKAPGVKKFLGVPEVVPVAQPSTQQPSLNVFAALKQATAASKEHSTSSSAPKLTDQRISSSSVLSQRIKTLEKQVKGKKKNKRR